MGIIEEHIKREQYIEEVAAYIRVSTTEQKLHGISLEAQVEKLEEYAAAHGMKIVEWYKDEGISGRKLIKKRPELQRMIHDAQAGKFKRIIFIKLDRFFRSVAEYHECMKLIDPVTWTATEEKYDLSTAQGRLLVGMKLQIAELEADQTGERIRLVNEYKIKSGQPLYGSKSFPLCYAVGQPENGERHKYVTKRDPEIMMDLIEYVEKYASVRGGLIYINNKYDRQYNYNAVRNALSNEMICGEFKGNPNYCEPYISRERFDKLQKILKKNPRTSVTERAYIFTGLIICPDCGRRLNSYVQQSSRQTKRGKVINKFQAYRCQKNNTMKQCDFGTCVFEKSLETEVLNNIEEILNKKKAKLLDMQAETERVSKYNLPELQKELERLNYAWQKGRIKDVDEYDRRYDELQNQIDAANEERKIATDEPDYDRIQEIFSGDWKAMYNQLDNEHKRAFWRSFIDEIHIGAWGRNVKEITDIKFF